MNVELMCGVCGSRFKRRGDRVAKVHICGEACRNHESARALRLFCHTRQNASGCWEWTGHITRIGYGKVTVNGRSALAHRAAYELVLGPIADEMTLDHLCKNKVCCNPLHLQQVSRSENLKRSWGKYAA